MYRSGAPFGGTPFPLLSKRCIMSKVQSPAQAVPEVRDESQPTCSPASGRETNGQFGKGNHFARGNPFARQLAGNREATLAVVTTEMLQNIMLMLAAKALEGSVSAARLVLLYAVGKPMPAPEPDRLEIDEWKLRQEAAVETEKVLELIDQPTAEMGNACVGIAQPVRQQAMIEPFLKEMRGEAPPGSADKAAYEMMKADLEREEAFESMRERRFEETGASDWDFGGDRSTAFNGDGPGQRRE
jgi:hypothetical protein